MSIKLVTLVWDRFPGSGSDLLAMLAFADYANDDGDNIYPSVATMAARMRLRRRQAQRVIGGLLESNWIALVANQSGGAPGSTRVYRLNVMKLRQQSLFDADGTGVLGDTGVLEVTGVTQDADGCTGRRRRVSPKTQTGVLEDTQTVIDPSLTNINTSRFMFELIRILNPNHREPNFDAWANDIRLMRERDGRTDAEIRALFEWANQHHFWKTNILSPATLRKQWDKLVIQRDNPGDHHAARQDTRSRAKRVSDRLDDIARADAAKHGIPDNVG